MNGLILLNVAPAMSPVVFACARAVPQPLAGNAPARITRANIIQRSMRPARWAEPAIHI